MFNVTRTYPEPDSIKNKQYNKDDVLSTLRPMFFEKCYLCERDDIQDVEVEHFIPHQKDETLKYNWNNLYYSCSRCNSIKSNTHIDLLDCTDGKIDIGGMITCKMPSAPSEKVTVRATHSSPCNKSTNTVTLLEHCYNSENTALRGISRDSLLEQMWDHYTDLIVARQVLRRKKSGKSVKAGAEETIEAMLEVRHPFSIFWRNFFLNDSFLMSN
ncbi:MAG: HNH endonuclease [Pseudomonas marincola]